MTLYISAFRVILSSIRSARASRSFSSNAPKRFIERHSCVDFPLVVALTVLSLGPLDWLFFRCRSGDLRLGDLDLNPSSQAGLRELNRAFCLSIRLYRLNIPPRYSRAAGTAAGEDFVRRGPPGPEAELWKFSRNRNPVFYPGICRGIRATEFRRERRAV